jgi:hypothetical protein
MPTYSKVCGKPGLDTKAPLKDGYLNGAPLPRDETVDAGELRTNVFAPRQKRLEFGDNARLFQLGRDADLESLKASEI